MDARVDARLGSRPPGLRVGPADDDDVYVYASVGAWRATEERASRRSEFMIVAPDETPYHVETLSMLANFQADPATRDLGYGDVLDYEPEVVHRPGIGLADVDR